VTSEKPGAIVFTPPWGGSRWPSAPPKTSANCSNCCSGKEPPRLRLTTKPLQTIKYSDSFPQKSNFPYLFLFRGKCPRRDSALAGKGGQQEKKFECQFLIPVKQFQTDYGMFSKKSFKLFIFVCINMNLFLKIKKWIPLL